MCLTIVNNFPVTHKSMHLIIKPYTLIYNTCNDIPYVGKFWRGKILANLANGLPFAKIFPANIYKYDEIPEQNYYNNGGTAKVF